MYSAAECCVLEPLTDITDGVMKLVQGMLHPTWNVRSRAEKAAAMSKRHAVAQKEAAVEEPVQVL